MYTRNGNFRLDSANFLVNSQGLRVLGYAADSDFNLIQPDLNPLEVSLGSKDVRGTTAVSIAGALSPTGTVATQGTLQTSAAILDSSTGLAATSATLLTNVRLNGDLGTAVFAGTDTISFTPSRGGRQLETKAFNVTSGTPSAVRTLASS